MGGKIIEHDADALGPGEVDVYKVAHTSGEVDRSPTLGDLDLAPGPMGIDEYEQVSSPVALILAVVTLDLARLSRNRLAHLADELGRALIETDHWALPIGFFSIEIEHILHAGNVFGIDLWNAPHVFAPGLEVIFSQTSPYRLARDFLVFGELDHRTCQQLQRPAGAAHRWLRTGGRHQ